MNTTECLWCHQSLENSVSTYFPEGLVFTEKNLYVETDEPYYTACDQHLCNLKSKWTVVITMKRVVLEAEEMLEKARQVQREWEQINDQTTKISSPAIYRKVLEYALRCTDGRSWVVTPETGRPEAAEDVSIPVRVVEACREIVGSKPLKGEVEILVADEFTPTLSEIPIAKSIRKHDFSKKVSCDDCGRHENLWLNLADGYVGCGRKQYGLEGSGCQNGLEGAAIRHWEQCKENHVGLKLGTLTSVNAELYSYSFDTPVNVPRQLLDACLKTFGLDREMWSENAHEKSLAELAADANKNLSISQGFGKEQMVNNEGVLGMQNLGNTCYISCIVHCLKLINLYETNDLVKGEDRRDESVASALNILIHTLLTTEPDVKYAREYGQVFSKTMKALRDLVGKTVADPSSSDPSRADPSSSDASRADASGDYGKVFEGSHFDETYHYGAPKPLFLKRLIGYKYHSFNNNEQQDAEEYFQLLVNELPQQILKLFLLEGAENISSSPNPFHSPLLDVMISRSLQIECCQNEGKTIDFNDLILNCDKQISHYPKFMFVVVRRMTQIDTDNRKLNNLITGQFLEYDFGNLKMTEETSGSLKPENSTGLSEQIINEAAALGFSANQCQIAARKLGQPITLEALASYILDNPDIMSDDITERITMVMSMGYSKDQAEIALNACNGNIEDAVNHLLIHNGEVGQNSCNDTPYTGSTKYTLIATVNHTGSSLHAGHYFVMNRYPTGKWYHINDEYVKTIDDEDTLTDAIGSAYLLLYKRLD
ncbi:ubiquitin carboxyl-terminal hydrolase [Gregarina niphandrodes]|uniref:ubiquitinyl hydrolase 1 n=1 Tax=Gregarina niphandrodes TaxID=110365 RepID=A0A023B627_GRENI|nr:ubiquitin carboxyl-terminal hydrolase [Gregarina niphandrodes]EZG65384.1 ubiquitin carboxyl-terminal hydrolase [Gregarina niphandrodes]|eukprot:XP_011134089.1 ubiquitin carboxyl-terminal hydrolase [Gregarina niphandrodes]